MSLFSALVNTRGFEEVGDREVGCRNAGCERTWTWSREVQASAKLRGVSAKPPKRQCDTCYAKERALTPQDVPCRVRGCAKAWTWDVDAQLRHRVWFEREKARHEASLIEKTPVADSSKESTASDGAKDGGAQRPQKNKRREKKRAAPKDGPPSKLCESCETKIKTVTPRDVSCKVHGCGQIWVWNREQQLEVWAKLETHDGSVTPKNPRRMCKRCFDFCRRNKDEAVECGKPGCDRTWNYQVGARLQDHLAGRTAPSSKLACDFSKGAMDCEFRSTIRVALAQLPPGAELMPCAVPGCVGKWVFTPGMELSSSGSEGTSVDHMCDHHRLSFGTQPRGAVEALSEPDVTAPATTPDASPAVDLPLQEPAGEEPAGEEPAGEEPAGEEPAADDASALSQPSPDTLASDAEHE